MKPPLLILITLTLFGCEEKDKQSELAKLKMDTDSIRSAIRGARRNTSLDCLLFIANYETKLGERLFDKSNALVKKKNLGEALYNIRGARDAVSRSKSLVAEYERLKSTPSK